MGGSAVLSFISQNKLIIAVDENETAMKVSSVDFNNKSNIIHVRSYAEAAGYLVAHKSGILFESITSKVSKLTITQDK